MIIKYDEQQRLAMQEEAAAVVRLNLALAIIEADLNWYWNWGDGLGGYVIERLVKMAYDAGFDIPREYLEEEFTIPSSPSKRKIPYGLRKQVFERDAYRCRSCQGHIDLCCDHVMPESKGGETVFENLQTLCRPCNSRKGTKVPA